MSGALDWIGQLVAWFASLIPRFIIVQENQALLKYVRGRIRVVKGPRFALYWPFTTIAENYWTAEQVVTLNPQMLATDDGKTVAVQAIMCFRMTDVVRYGAGVFEAEESIAEAAGEAVRRVVMSSTLQKLQEGRADMDHKLTKEAQKATERFGVEVTKLRLTSLVPARIFGVFAANYAPDRAQGGGKV